MNKIIFKFLNNFKYNAETIYDYGICFVFLKHINTNDLFRDINTPSFFNGTVWIKPKYLFNVLELYGSLASESFMEVLNGSIE